MMHVTRRRLFTALAVTLSLTAFCLLALSFVRSTRTQASSTEAQIPAQAAPTPCTTCGGDEDKPHVLAASYYSLANNLSATLMLNNKGPKPLEVKPTLFGTRGERLDLAPVMVEPMSFREIDLRDFQIAGTVFEEGSLQLFHRGKDLVLGAEVKLIDSKHSLIFEEKLVELATEFASSRLEGVLYIPSRQTDVRLVLSNTSESALTVTARVSDGTLKSKEPLQEVLLPHETRVISVQRDDEEGRGLEAAGGVSIEHSGATGALLARAFIQDEKRGYSSFVRFTDPQKAKSSKLHGAGLRVGDIAGEALTPVAVARNIGNAASVVTGRVPYTLSDGKMGVAKLPETRLAPGEAKVINIAEAVKQSVNKQRVAAAGVEFEYSSAPGSVLITATSVSRSGNQVFNVPLWDIMGQRSSTGGYPWSIDGTSSTMVYLKNVSPKKQDYVLQLDYSGGVYGMGIKSVEVGQTVAIDVRKLRDEQVPDEQGAKIPLDATRGQIQWSVRSIDKLPMIGRVEQVDVARALASSYACQNCCQNVYYSSWMSPGSGNIYVGQSMGLSAFQRDANCYGTALGSYQVSSYGIDWYSNGAVATSYLGNVTGMGGGYTSVYGYWDVIYGSYAGGGECESYYTNISVSAGISVLRPIVQTESASFAPTSIRGVGLTPGGDPYPSTTLTVQVSTSPGVRPGSTVKVEIFEQNNPTGVQLDVSDQVEDLDNENVKTVTLTAGRVSLVTFSLVADQANTTTGDMIRFRARIVPNSLVSGPGTGTQDVDVRTNDVQSNNLAVTQ